MVLGEIQARAKQGLPLSATDLNEGEHRDAVLYFEAGALFKSWPKAVEAAGYRYKDVTPPFPYKYPSAESVVAEIKRRCIAGMPINSSAVTHAYGTRDGALMVAARKFFGAWGSAVAVAGSDYAEVRLKRPNPYRTKRAVVRELRRRAKQGAPITSTGVTRGACRDNALYEAGVRLFGGWRGTRRAAGPERRIP
ncbi:MAG: hypothetical protein HQ582_03040 [Planctomycetes bacterium]|nr:hypothetical protein [Planctomycetota bacterium]